MRENKDGLIKFLIKGFIAIGIIMALYLILYTFFYDSRIYISNLHNVISILFVKAKLNFTDNLYVNLFIVYLVILIATYVLEQYIMKCRKNDKGKKTTLKLEKGTKMSKNSRKSVKN